MEKFKIIVGLGVVTDNEGRHFRVTVWGHAREGTISTSEERLLFLKNVAKTTFLGEEGIRLLDEQKKLGPLPINTCCASFDEDGFSDTGMSVTGRDSDGNLFFRVGIFEGDWNDQGYFFCFHQEYAP